MSEKQARGQLGIRVAAVVFALLLVAVGAATTVHPAYADDECHDDNCGNGCVANVAGISVCTSVRTDGPT